MFSEIAEIERPMPVELTMKKISVQRIAASDPAQGIWNQNRAMQKIATAWKSPMSTGGTALPIRICDG